MFSCLTNNFTFAHFYTEFKLRNVNLQQVQNQIRHRTDGLSSSTLVLRRGQPFTILMNYDGRPFDPLKEKLVFRIVLGMFVCALMRALGIPTRVVTNFNSAHDTNGNMVIEEFYSEMGKKLSIGRDSIWVTIQPRETMRSPVRFIPRMTGAKMLHASLVLMNLSTVLRGFKTINVQAA
ncbi:Protein-glutamine gamma-glutamyltransferase 5 [Anabarilius grahami]|uniref:Protein-glutamine gamma-glutamyltransferase 5 n=1 Tax=Anabarilius grahami TaxID=495550 RepID=A0A3N0Y393_ANAGA|nr:Protein-glutamine gamma-glutamyltransferase 5 [Anabarilius grahami]